MSGTGVKYGNISGIEKPISRLIYGTANSVLSRAESPDASESEKKAAFVLLDEVFSVGINTFDCAAIYGESILGEWMEQRGNRESCVVFSKCAHPNAWRHRVTDFDILSDLHDSLKRLRVKNIDCYLLHRDCRETPVSQIMDVLNRLYQEGKISSFGVSNWTQTRIEEANNYALCHGLVPLAVSSPQFSLAEQLTDPFTGAKYSDPSVSLSDYANRSSRFWYRTNQMPVIAYSSLARGWFSGRFTSTDDDETIKSSLDSLAILAFDCRNNRERLHRCEELAAKKGCFVSQIALAWLFSQRMNVYAVTGAPSGKYLTNSIEALSQSLTEEECAWLDLEM